MQAVKNKNAVRHLMKDRTFYIIVHIVMAFMLLITLYPIIYVISSSFSSPQAVSTGQVRLWPVDFSVRGYKEVFNYQVVWIGYGNTLFYTVVGTLINVTLTLFCAFALSKRTLPGRSFFTFLFSFTMLFGGGLIPSYLVMRTLGIINTRWIMILPGAVNVYNMIVTRTFISNIPQELSEASQIDGCSDFRYFGTILLPLSKAVIAVIALYYAVGHWNAYFNALIYLNNRELFPLQVFLRDILVLNAIDPSSIMDPEEAQALEGMRDLLKYAMIVVSTVPIMCVYPFLQKFFAQGVLVGSVKG